MNRFLMMGALAAMAVTPAVNAADDFSSEQKKNIEKVVHDYLVNNPEVLIEASQSLQKKQQENMQVAAKTAIIKNADTLFSGNMTLIGNPKGNVTLVEFFDYQCSHCKRMAPVISELVKNNNNLRVIYKELPILNEQSELAAKAALAASMQGKDKYKAMHNALIKLQQRLNEKLIFETAKSAGLNVEKLKKDMKSEKITAELQENNLLAKKLRLAGTPAFIIAATPDGKFQNDESPSFIPGAASEESLQNIIKDKSKAKSE